MRHWNGTRRRTSGIRHYLGHLVTNAPGLALEPLVEMLASRIPTMTQRCLPRGRGGFCRYLQTCTRRAMPDWRRPDGQAGAGLLRGFLGTASSSRSGAPRPDFFPRPPQRLGDRDRHVKCLKSFAKACRLPNARRAERGCGWQNYPLHTVAQPLSVTRVRRRGGGTG